VQVRRVRVRVRWLRVRVGPGRPGAPGNLAAPWARHNQGRPARGRLRSPDLARGRLRSSDPARTTPDARLQPDGRSRMAARRHRGAGPRAAGRRLEAGSSDPETRRAGTAGRRGTAGPHAAGRRGTADPGASGRAEAAAVRRDTAVTQGAGTQGAAVRQSAAGTQSAVVRRGTARDGRTGQQDPGPDPFREPVRAMGRVPPVPPGSRGGGVAPAVSAAGPRSVHRAGVGPPSAPRTGPVGVPGYLAPARRRTTRAAGTDPKTQQIPVRGRPGECRGDRRVNRRWSASARAPGADAGHRRGRAGRRRAARHRPGPAPGPPGETWSHVAGDQRICGDPRSRRA
jgi:hypothetical protein